MRVCSESCYTDVLPIAWTHWLGLCTGGVESIKVESPFKMVLQFAIKINNISSSHFSSSESYFNGITIWIKNNTLIIAISSTTRAIDNDMTILSQFLRQRIDCSH